MQSEIKSFIIVWTAAFASLTFCYFIVRKIPRGIMRLLSLLPIISIFTLLPFNLSSVHLETITFLSITSLANFKLLHFAFNKGPLSSNPSSLSLLHFISIGCLPIEIKHQDQLLQTPQKGENMKNKQSQSHQTIKKFFKSPLHYAFKVLFLALGFHVYYYRESINQYLISVLYWCYLYIAIEFLLAVCSFPARTILRIEIEPYFDKPYLSTSIQNFWGKRWNLIVSSMLRFTIYHPTRSISTRIFGRRCATSLAIVATFVVSGLMHELFYFYLTHVKPTWEVTLYFVLQGVCTAMEVELKKASAGRWQLHRAISGPLAIGFVVVTSFWLFIPQIRRNGVDMKAIGEYDVLVGFVKDQVLKPWRLM